MTDALRAQPKASHFIDGAYIEDNAGEALEILYPATGEVIARLHQATPQVIEAALASAKRAQRAWAATAPAARGAILREAARLIRERAEELAVLETLDTGKPLQETRVADWPSGADALDYFAGLAPSVTGEMIPLGGEDFAYTRREPLGLCLGIGAWNYPSQAGAFKAAPALALGNSMVFKPSELTPLGALKLAEILHEAGLPAGVFNVVCGAGAVGEALVRDARVRKISLTGSVPTGQRIYQAAADRLLPLTLELGGKSPLVIFDDAPLEDAVGGALLANYYSAGQICSNGTRVFVQEALLPAFMERLQERATAIRLGDPLDPETQMGPLISQAQFDKVIRYIEGAKAEGARLLFGGRQAALGGLYVEPTAFIDVADDMTLAREEVFGPVMAIFSFKTEEEAIARANATEYGLAAGVFTRDMARAHRVIAALEAGTCWINTYNTTPVEMPFGGMKLSGLGRENGRAAVESYTQVKAVQVAMGPVDAPY